MSQSIRQVQDSLGGIDTSRINVTETVNPTTNPRKLPPNESQPGTLLGASMRGESGGEGEQGETNAASHEAQAGGGSEREGAASIEGVHVYQPAGTIAASGDGPGE